MMNIKKGPKLPPVPFSVNPPFGTIFAPHVLKMKLQLEGPNNFDSEIIPLANEPFPPTMAVLHYGQSIFEGMKAYRQPDNGVGVFRADLHATRFRQSAKRMVMADIPEEIFLNCIKEYVSFVADNVPSEPGHSLYLRPLLIAEEPKIKVGSSKTYLFYIMSSIAGNYFSASGTAKMARVMVCPNFVRAYPNGLGEVKTAANYATSIWPQHIASQKDCDQVLFLNAIDKDSIDELGGMNFFAVRGQELITPKLNGCILNGVTRRSILELASSLNLKPIETNLSFSNLRKDIETGAVTEAFACGTAAVVSPIGELVYAQDITAKPEVIKLNNNPTIGLKILDKISKVQRGAEAAPGNWIFKCNN